MIAFQLFM